MSADTKAARQPASEGGTLALRRRRPPSPLEHARRVAWGKKYGGALSAALRDKREDG